MAYAVMTKHPILGPIVVEIHDKLEDAEVAVTTLPDTYVEELGDEAEV